jgi:hypothetical protein
MANDRIEVFGSLEGAEVWSPLLTVDPIGKKNFSNLSGSSYSNPWLLQATVGGRIAVDNQRRFWFGAQAKHSRNQESAITKQWDSVTGFASFSFGGK